LLINNYVGNFSELPVSWNHIGGLDGIINQIKETVILPFQRHEYFKQCKLFMPPKGTHMTQQYSSIINEP